jgi:hypothetical protein
MRTTNYRSRVIVRIPDAISELLEVTARLLMTSRSDYIRRAVLAQLKKDGIELPK